MIGARDLAFPRLNAFGFWIFLFGGLLLHFSFIGGDGLYGAGSAPAVGWFAYAPLTERAFTPGNATDYWNLSILVAGVGTIATAHQHRRHDRSTMRGPGMTLGRMPIFVWTMLTVSAHDPDHPAAAVGGPDHAAPRPLPRRPLLRHPGRRVGRDVAALLLVLRPSRGLRPDAAGLRLRLRDHPGLLPQGASSATRPWWPPRSPSASSPGRLGPPHVRGRHGAHARTRSSPPPRC